MANKVVQQARACLAMIVIVAFFIWSNLVVYKFGRSVMHKELVDDMKRYEEAPLLCRDKAGNFYLFSSSDIPTGYPNPKTMEVKNGR